MPPGRPTAAIPIDSSSGVWERISTWASENKAVVYTIAGVAVAFTGAGVVYYLNDAVCVADAASDPGAWAAWAICVLAYLFTDSYLVLTH